MEEARSALLCPTPRSFVLQLNLLGILLRLIVGVVFMVTTIRVVLPLAPLSILLQLMGAECATETIPPKIVLVFVMGSPLAVLL